MIRIPRWVVFALGKFSEIALAPRRGVRRLCPSTGCGRRWARRSFDGRQAEQLLGRASARGGRGRNPPVTGKAGVVMPEIAAEMPIVAEAQAAVP